MRRFSLFLVVLVTITASGIVETDAGETVTQPIQIQFDLSDLNGQLHLLSQNDQHQYRVFVFLSTFCPISNSYTQELNRLQEALPGNMQIYGVISDMDVKLSEAIEHFTFYKTIIPILFDASGMLADMLQPTHVPEVFVLESKGKIVYRGAIDNAYESIGRRRPQAEKKYLQEAISALANGKEIELTYVKPVGCFFPKPSEVSALTDVTFTRDIAPIIQSRCQNCHREGQVAPFSLTNYKETTRHAEMIIEVTQRRIMPPWMPKPGAQPKFLGERWLTDRELAILKSWVDAGCPEGDDDNLPPAPKFAEGWRLGEPDLVVKMQEPFTIPADGPDLLQNFVIPIDIDNDKMVAAIEFHQGNRRVVHHAVLFLDDKGQARKLDSATPEPGYSSFGGAGFLPSGALGGWSVGNTPRHLPNNMGRYLKQGSDLVVQIHYHPSGKEETDQSEIGIYFVDKPVKELLQERAKLVGSFWMANYEMDIPPGEANYERSTTYTLPKDITLVGIVPHMHLLGKSMRVTATLPDGDVKTLVDVPEWNFNWQDEYYYERPFRLPSGTTLRVEAVFDNSGDNPSNPSSPPQRVTWGDGTFDEMLFCFFLATSDKTEDLIHVVLDSLGNDLKQPRSER
ncbi:redoxin family protein [uncultured Rubinisphaera sp.]|uniref:redoxin family protein n=1 Tax=uncultured Rubinisphaera sp. TaxID=1678686 RepID=UPI0030DAAEA6